MPDAPVAIQKVPSELPLSEDAASKSPPTNNVGARGVGNEAKNEAVREAVTPRGASYSPEDRDEPPTGGSSKQIDGVGAGCAMSAARAVIFDGVEDDTNENETAGTDNDCEDADSAYVTAMEQIWAEAEAWVDAEAQVGRNASNQMNGSGLHLDA